MYSRFYQINKNFQSSVNLELDLFNNSKINEYIPTSDICDVLKKYVKVALGLSKDKATTLIGPYGKGKSFLLLVLSYIFSDKKEEESWENLALRIKEIDKELYSYLIEVKNKKITLLPILINSNYDNITQSFQIALNEALRREGLDEIIPNSAFDVCIGLLDKWSSQNSIKDDVLNKCLDLNNLSLKKLRTGLENYSPTAYRQFEKLYNCVNIGLDFNPLISNDIVKTYSDISLALPKYGYSGMFIIFDEFSKFIESNTSNLMKDLKIVQDMAELCARTSKTNQIQLCCVAHKSIALYEDNEKGKNYAVDSFKTVEGRFKEIRFNRSLEENYQIIASAIKKTADGKKYSSEAIFNDGSFYSAIKELDIFNNVKDETLFNGCYPLNPLTAYCLIQISEYSAQNERTLFTFLSDTDDDSFNSFIHNSSEGLFNVDKIYDYFSPLLQKEETNYIRNIWYRTESILSKLEDQNERKVIKALSIVLMINDLEKFPSNEKILSLSLHLDEKNVNRIIENLINKHYLRKNLLNNLLSFALSNTKQIDEAVELYKKTKFKNVRYSDFADIVNDRKFILPRKYNEENKIVRFFKISFMSETEFLSIKSFDYYFENNYCDGLTIYLLREKSEESELIDKMNQLNDDRIIIKYPLSEIKDIFYQSLVRYACLCEVKKQKGLDEITSSEIDLLLQETESDIKSLINKYFNDDCNYYSVIDKNKESKTFGMLASLVMEHIYPTKLIFNNELINKKDVTTQYQKAINHVIDWLLDGEGDFVFSPTSPETSIKTSVLDNNADSIELRSIIDEIKNQISNSAGRKINIVELLSPYLKRPYGIRNGVIPIVFAKALSELSDNIVVYFQSKEIELNSNNLVKSVFNDKYQLSFSKGSIEQKNYLKKMMVLFKCNSCNNFRKDVFVLSESIKKFFVGLPQIIRLSTVNNNFVLLDEKFINYKNLFLTFNINPYEAIFDEPKIIFDSKKYEDIFKAIQKIVNNQSVLLITYKNILSNRIKSIFNIKLESSIKTGLNDYISLCIKNDERPILESSEKKVFEALTSIESYDDITNVDYIAKCVTGFHIEDWDSDKSNDVLSILTDLKENLQHADKVKNDSSSILNFINKDTEITGMASLLKNNMEAILDEFSDSVSSNDKIAVLTEILKKYL